MGRPRVLVLGGGSIGSRHARNLLDAGAHVALMDPEPARRDSVPGAEGLPLNPARLDGFDGIVVASPTRFHAEQARAALATGSHVLVEKPLVADVAELDGVLEAGPGRIMVGYNLRLHQPVERLVAIARSGRLGPIALARLWFGNYLPSWRPQVDYRTTYSARADLGGGILADAVHELDLAVWLFGPDLVPVGSVVERVGSLDIDVEDVVLALLRGPGGVSVEITLDYLSRRYRRGIELIGEEANARLDWARTVVEVEDEAGVTAEAVDVSVASTYERQAEVFLAWIRGEADPPVDGPTGAASVRLAAAIREVAR